MRRGPNRWRCSLCKQVYDSRHPHFVLYAAQQVEQVLGPELASKGGLRIYTTLDARCIQRPKRPCKSRWPHWPPKTATTARSWRAAGHRRGAGAGRQRGLRQCRNQRTDQYGAGPAPARLSPQAVCLPGHFRDTRGRGDRASGRCQATRAGQRVEHHPGHPYGGSAQVSAIEPPGYWTPATAIMDVRTEFSDGEGRPPYVPYNYGGNIGCQRTRPDQRADCVGQFVQHPGRQGVGTRRPGSSEGRGKPCGHHHADPIRLRPVAGFGRRRCHAVGADGRVRDPGQRRRTVPLSPIACVLDAKAN